MADSGISSHNASKLAENGIEIAGPAQIDVTSPLTSLTDPRFVD